MLPRSLPEHHALAPLPRPFPQFQSELISRRREVGEAPRKEEAFEDAYHVVRTAARGRRIVWPVCVLSRIHATVPEGAVAPRGTSEPQDLCFRTGYTWPD
jgi:hypothetical protein